MRRFLAGRRRITAYIALFENWRHAVGSGFAQKAGRRVLLNGSGTWATSGKRGYFAAPPGLEEPGLKISIVIPNYNSGAVLQRALDSVLSQGYADLELIVVDSESTDVSRDIIERYRTQLDVLIVEKDQGQADGLNKGFARATGDLCGWLCADDELTAGTLAHVAELFAKQPRTEVLLGACERIYADGSRCIIPPAADPWKKIAIQDVIEQASTFWRASLHRRCGPLETKYHLAFDWDLWCRMAKLGAVAARTDRVLARYYFSQDNKTSRSGSLFAHEAFTVIRQHGPMNGTLGYLYWMLYRHFDLHGCYDSPPTCTRLRGRVFTVVLLLLRAIFGTRLVYMYNWHFASLQQRGKQWW
jgi:Glycosyl transferase family 2